MSERVEWRVVCADFPIGSGTVVSREQAEALMRTWDKSEPCGPHRVQSRTVSTSEWADTDVDT